MPVSASKAYYVTEASKGSTFWLVYANSIREIRENWPNVECFAIDSQSHPNGLSEIRREPGEDRASVSAVRRELRRTGVKRRGRR